MNKKRQIAFRIELIWLLFTLLVYAALITPILIKIPNFPFYGVNLLFVAVFITASRYIFLLPGTFLARRQVLKIAFIFLSIPLIFFLVGEIYDFQTFLDEEGIQSLTDPLPLAESFQIGRYIRNEILLFGVGSVIATGVFAFRMLISVWRLHNRGTV